MGFLFYWDCILIAWIQYFSKSDMEPVLFYFSKSYISVSIQF